MAHFAFETTGKEVVAAFKDQVQGRTILITGPSSGGIGAETALSLAAGNPYTLLLAGRSEAKALPVLQAIQKECPSIRCEFIQIDLGDQASIRKAAADVHQRLGSSSTIDIIINNAGILGSETFEKTVDGVEAQFATNHLGHFLFTNLLMDKLLPGTGGKEAGRVVNLTSTAWEGSNVNFSDVNFQDGKTYNIWYAYAQAKCANMLFTLGLKEKFGSKGLTAFSVHPGVISGTGLATHVSNAAFKEAWAGAKAREAETGRVFRPDKSKNVQQGCATTLVAALDPSLEASNGAYLRDCNVFDDVIDYAKDPMGVEKLWVLSEKLVGQQFEA